MRGGGGGRGVKNTETRMGKLDANHHMGKSSPLEWKRTTYVPIELVTSVVRRSALRLRASRRVGAPKPLDPAFSSLARDGSARSQASSGNEGERLQCLPLRSSANRFTFRRPAGQSVIGRFFDQKSRPLIWNYLGMFFPHLVE